MNIPDSLCQQLAAAISSAETPPPSIGPAWFDVAPGFMGGPPFTVTLHPLDGSPASILTVGHDPKDILPSVRIPVTITYNLGMGGQFDTILTVGINATKLQGVRVMSIIPNPNGKQTEIDLYIPSNKQIVILQVASVPAGIAADIKNYTFFYLPAQSGGLDQIIDGTIQSA